MLLLRGVSALQEYEERLDARLRVCFEVYVGLGILKHVCADENRSIHQFRSFHLQRKPRLPRVVVVAPRPRQLVTFQRVGDQGD